MALRCLLSLVHAFPCILEHFVFELSDEEALKLFPGGSISKITLIIKTCDDGTVKRRIIVDPPEQQGLFLGFDFRIKKEKRSHRYTATRKFTRT